ncbi:MAG: hypothetical protein WBM14_00850 [Terracidiphilus sp.]
MSTHLLGAVSICAGSLHAHKEQENLLAAVTEELAILRFSIILTARREASAGGDAERRDELRAELLDLRREYSLKIDDIAMAFGVQNAMKAKEEVERTVTVPLGMDIAFTTSEDDYLSI